MSTQASSAFHRIVVEDVIKGIREDFINEGVDEQVLEDLKQLWESKLVQNGVYDYPPAPVHNYNTAYDMSNYNNYLDTSHTQPTGLLPMAPQNSLYNMNSYIGQTAAARGGNTAAHHAALSALRQLNPTPSTLSSNTTTSNYNAYTTDPSGKPQPFLAPPPGSGGWNTQPTVPGINTQYNPPNIKQNDGANDEKDAERLKIDAMLLKKFAKVQKLKNKKTTKKSNTTATTTDSTLTASLNSSHNPSDSKIPQFDGLGDKKGQEDDDDDDDEEGSKGDEELGSDLDDDEEDEEPDTEHIVLCQYEKVTRVKNKRKANLKDGIMHINGKDYVFSKATGEFDW